MIRFNQVSRVYGKGEAAAWALRGVSFEIDRQEFVSIMGPSGSGKSTAMNIIGCLDSPSSGDYFFDGTNASGLSRDGRAMLRRENIGFVFQGFNLLGRTSALENVELPLLYRGEKRKDREEKAMEALKLVGLEQVIRHTPAELSGGQQQRVAIARAIVTNPLVLLADEPTGNLDTARSYEIMELLSKLNSDQKITIAMVTHEDEMAAFTKRKISFRDGLIESDERLG